MNERLGEGGERRKTNRSRRRFVEPSPVTSQVEQLTPEQKTETFFDQDVILLAEAMRGRIIASQEDGRMIRIDNLESWSADRVGNRYTKSGNNLRLTELTPGTLGIFTLPVRRMRQSLISARNGGELGACVRLVRASRYDSGAQQFVPMPREGDIANYFEFENNQAVRLKFVDDSEILYFNKGENKGIRVKAPKPKSEQAEINEANQYLRDLVK